MQLKIPIILTVLFFAGIYSIFFAFDTETVFYLADEDELIENAGALFFLGSSLLFFTAFNRKRKTTGKSKPGDLVLIGLAALFLFGFLEEISWGQRIFGIDTPEILQGSNKQRELNIHNLEIFHPVGSDGGRKLFSMERLFTLFWLGFCILIPATYRIKSPVKAFLDKEDFPVVPLPMGLLFALNYLISKWVGLQVEGGMSHHDLAEVKETGFAFVFFLVSFWFAGRSSSPGSRANADGKAAQA